MNSVVWRTPILEIPEEYRERLNEIEKMFRNDFPRGDYSICYSFPHSNYPHFDFHRVVREFAKFDENGNLEFPPPIITYMGCLPGFIFDEAFEKELREYLIGENDEKDD